MSDLMNWEEIRVNLQLLTRTNKDLKIYREFRAKIEKEYGLIDNYLIKQVLKWNCFDINNNNMSSSSPSEEEYFTATTSYENYSLKLNDFPYAIDPSITHYILWSKLPFNPNDNDNREVELFIKEKFGDNKEWLWFINPIRLQSIRSIHHGHIFIREKQIINIYSRDK
ncbi:11215_t:CDS:2 [Entrophospora sp. SA101]|nr:11215_t:CDS:2 [Entrophospora sp. SA101]